MCGVIVVDAGRSRSTWYGRDAYIHDHCLRYRHNFAPAVICSPTVIFLILREASSETYGPWVSFHHICLCDLFSIAFIFRSIKLKIQKYLATIYFLFILFGVWSINLLELSPVRAPISGAVTRKGLTTPLTRRIAGICYLCAGAIYVVLLGSPAGSITLVSYLREIPTAAVLHHPFLFGEIPR